MRAQEIENSPSPTTASTETGLPGVPIDAGQSSSLAGNTSVYPHGLSFRDEAVGVFLVSSSFPTELGVLVDTDILMEFCQKQVLATTQDGLSKTTKSLFGNWKNERKNNQQQKRR